MTIAPDSERRVPPSALRNRLRDAREWRGLDQADLARELGVGRSTVSNYERGITDPGKLVINAWAVICDVDVEWLKTGVEQPEQRTPDGGGTVTVPYQSRKSTNGDSNIVHLFPIFGQSHKEVA